MRTTRLSAAALATATALALSACSGGDDGEQPAISGPTASADKAATVLDRPFEKPEVVLTDTEGKKFDLVEETKGRPTLLYFGYTHCPDICPLTVSNIAIAQKKLKPADRKKLRVVFITSDPKRDTPGRLGSWLRGAGDPSFVGLTGDFEDIQAAARSVGIGIAPPKKGKGGEIVSTHGAQVIAFSPKDDKGHVLYGEDATVKDYTKDLPTLVEGGTP